MEEIIHFSSDCSSAPEFFKPLQMEHFQASHIQLKYVTQLNLGIIFSRSNGERQCFINREVETNVLNACSPVREYRSTLWRVSFTVIQYSTSFQVNVSLCEKKGPFASIDVYLMRRFWPFTLKDEGKDFSWVFSVNRMMSPHLSQADMTNPSSILVWCL